MTNEYVWNLQPWEQVLLWIGSLFMYVIGGGFTWALLPEDWDKDGPERFFAVLAWPITLVGYLVYRAAMIGPRTVTYWRQRNKLPRAEARRLR